MLSLIIKRYQHTNKKVWDNFLEAIDGPSLLFYRDYMDYHSDRFEDFSLMFYDDDNLIAVCPAHRAGDQLKSHWGLTYGGILFEKGTKAHIVEFCWEQLLSYASNYGFKSVGIKEIPSFYIGETAKYTNDYLQKQGVEIHKEPVFAIDYSVPLTIHKTKLKQRRKKEDFGFKIEETSLFSEFWNSVLIPRLQDKHQVAPVHSLAEIEQLGVAFPDKITQYNIYYENEILAGITIFDKGSVVKSQYGATTPKGEKMRALEFLFLHLIYKFKDIGKSFFSMGTIGDNRFLEGYNPGLKKHKEELGCTEFYQHFYIFEL